VQDFHLWQDNFTISREKPVAQLPPVDLFDDNLVNRPLSDSYDIKSPVSDDLPDAVSVERQLRNKHLAPLVGGSVVVWVVVEYPVKRVIVGPLSDAAVSSAPTVQDKRELGDRFA
jgi:hypothetical protein